MFTQKLNVVLIYDLVIFMFSLLSHSGGNNFSISLESISQCLLSTCAGFGLVLGVKDWAIKGRRLSSLIRCFKKCGGKKTLY